MEKLKKNLERYAKSSAINLDDDRNLKRVEEIPYDETLLGNSSS